MSQASCNSRPGWPRQRFSVLSAAISGSLIPAWSQVSPADLGYRRILGPGCRVSIWLIPRQGPAGAAIALSVAMPFSCVHAWIVSRRAFPLPFPGAAIAKIALACAAMAALVLAVPGLRAPSIYCTGGYRKPGLRGGRAGYRPGGPAESPPAQTRRPAATQRFVATPRDVAPRLDQGNRAWNWLGNRGMPPGCRRIITGPRRDYRERGNKHWARTQAHAANSNTSLHASVEGTLSSWHLIAARSNGGIVGCASPQPYYTVPLT